MDPIPRLSEAVVQWCSVEKVFLELSQSSQENNCARVSFLIKLQAKVCNFIKKKTLAQVFFCEFYEISKNNFLHRTPLVAASRLYQQHFELHEPKTGGKEMHKLRMKLLGHFSLPQNLRWRSM